MKLPGQNNNLTAMVLRIGLAFIFLYAGISSLKNPLLWEGYLPSFLLKSAHVDLIIKSIAVYEIALALWLLSGRYIRYAAALSALTLAGIIAVNTSQMIVTFRDVGLLFAAVALFFIEY